MSNSANAGKEKKQYSIRRYLTIHLIFWALFMTVLPGILVYLDAAHEVEEIFDANLAQSTRVLHGIINRDSIKHKQEILDSLHLKHNSSINDYAHEYEKKLAFQIWDQGELLFKSPNAPVKALSQLKNGFSYIDIDGKQWRSFSLYSEHDNWWLLLAERTDIRGELTTNISINHILPIVIFIPLLAFLVWFVTKKGLAPLNLITEKVKQRHYRNLKNVENQEAPLEVDELLQEINSLFSRLNEAHERERRFVGDAAHELRTPLASLLIHTENAIDESSNGEQEDSLISMKQGISRLSHLVAQLLSLSRTEGQQSQEQFTRVNVTQLCQQTFSQLAYKAEQKQQTLISEIDETPCFIEGNAPLLQSLIRNILDNGIRYTPEGGQIKLQCHQQQDKIVLQISDSGPGIPVELRERVTDRFYRVVGSGQQGSGLGLSIVDKIASIHQASWQLLDSELGGLELDGLSVRFEFSLAGVEDNSSFN